MIMLGLEERDLREFRESILNGVIVGIGSLVLQFSNATQVIVQCPFDVDDGKSTLSGHGELVDSSRLLFVLLNLRIDEIAMDGEAVISMKFEKNYTLRIIPERNGLESYVISTKHGIAPVAVI